MFEYKIYAAQDIPNPGTSLVASPASPALAIIAMNHMTNILPIGISIKPIKTGDELIENDNYTKYKEMKKS